MAEDPTGSFGIQMINKLQEAIQQSPAAAFKKGLAKLQAGNYDEVAVRAKLDSLIAEPAVMFCESSAAAVHRTSQPHDCPWRICTHRRLP